MPSKLHLAEDESFVPGRSRETAAKLIEAAAEQGLQSRVRTTFKGYIVPTSILPSDVEEAEAPSVTAAATQVPETETSGRPEETAGAEFDPSDHTVDEVEAYLATADDAERERVLAAEKAGKARKSLHASDTEEGK